ncbi:spore coat protein [Priestia sp. OVS21]|nr:spore coat protein [Priestia sp. OVS21]
MSNGTNNHNGSHKKHQCKKVKKAPSKICCNSSKKCPPIKCPPIFYPPKCCTKHVYQDVIVPHIHPVHLKVVKHTTFKHKHFFPTKITKKKKEKHKHFICNKKKKKNVCCNKKKMYVVTKRRKENTN